MSSRPRQDRRSEPAVDHPRERSTSKFPADYSIDRITATALEKDGNAEEQPEQGVLVSASCPEIPELPLETEDDDQHFDPDHGRGDPGEKPDRKAGSRDRFCKVGQIGQALRKRQPFGSNVRGKFGNWNVEYFL